MEEPLDVLFTGDFIVDHHLLKGNKSEASATGSIGTRSTNTHGGARLTFDLANHFLNRIISDPDNKVMAKFIWHFHDLPKNFKPEGTSHDSYLGWEISECKDRKQGNDKYLCKLIEEAGFGKDQKSGQNLWYRTDPKISSGKYKFTVIDEAGIGFRNRKASWPDFKTAGQIILKTTFPLCSGGLWEELIKHDTKPITIVNLNQIKHYNVRIGNRISWEQTALDIVYGIHREPRLRNLLSSSKLIITIGSAGAVIITPRANPEENEYSLIFDPEHMEGEWEEKHKAEIVNRIGLGSSFLAGFAASHCVKNLNIHDSVKVGLNTVNASLLKGILKPDETMDLTSNNLSSALDERFHGRYYSSAFIPSPSWSTGLEYIHNQEWSILENNYENRKKGYIPKADLHPLAFSLALNGIGSLHFAPRLSLGKVTIFDRSEIENLRNLRRLIEFYDSHEDGSKPLNISVFGPPGAGKSFIIKSLAKNILSNNEIIPAFITVNLSQFRDESELSGAFHAIRDEVLKGNIPVVFWDEFDSEDYRWLKSFIAPMQDGTFQEGKETHPIGKSIFIFAGSMTYTMDHFAEEMGKTALIGKKGPDFLSRIRGYLNVFGPNRKPWFNTATAQWCNSGDPKDNCYSIRRALFIRHALGTGCNYLNIDPQLLRALIEVSFYKNGARGLDRLLTNLSACQGRKIELSDLPSDAIIRMIVDYDDFMDLLEDTRILPRISFERLAEMIHNAWLDLKVKDSVYYEEYRDLNYDGRIDNVSAAERIGEIIATTGRFKVVEDSEFISGMLKDAGKEFDKHIRNVTNLDLLAEKEHEGWVLSKIRTGWIYGTRSDYHKIHHCLVPWIDLDPGITNPNKQEQKNKDRDTIKNYTSMLKGSGYTIVIPLQMMPNREMQQPATRNEQSRLTNL